MKTISQRKYLYLIVFIFLSCEKPFFSQESANILFTGRVVSVGFDSAIVSGDFVDVSSSEDNEIIEYGHVWATTEEPTVNDNKFNLGTRAQTGRYNSFLSNLTPETTYFSRAYIIDGEGIRYGETLTLTPGLVLTGLPFNISGESLVIQGQIRSSVDITTVQSFGHVWALSPNPNLQDNRTTLSVAADLLPDNSFESFIDGLEPNSRYYIRAYATSSQSPTVFGNQYIFDTGE